MLVFLSMHSASVAFHDRKVMLLDPCGVLNVDLYLILSFGFYPRFLWLVNSKSVVLCFLCALDGRLVVLSSLVAVVLKETLQAKMS